MAQRRSRKVMRGALLARNSAFSGSGIDRVSCAWRDAVGPGYAVGVSEGVARTVSPLGATRYCR